MLSRVLVSCAALSAVGATLGAGGKPVLNGGHAVALLLVVMVLLRAVLRWVRVNGPRILVGALVGYLAALQTGVAPLPAAVVGAVLGYWLIPRRTRSQLLTAAVMN